MKPLRLDNLAELKAAPVSKLADLDRAGPWPAPAPGDRRPALPIPVPPDPAVEAAKRDVRIAGGNTVPKLSIATPDEATVAVPFGAEHVTVTYRPALITQRLADRMQAAGDNLAVLETLADLIVSWDFVTDDGQPVPTTVDGLKDVPIPVLGCVAEAIAGAAASSPLQQEKRAVAGNGRRGR